MKTNNELSPIGEKRRAAMLPQIQSELMRSRQRRRLPAIGATLLLIVIGSVASHRWWNQSQADVDNERAQVGDTKQSTEPNHEINVASAQVKRVEFEVIDDQQLLAMLEETGHPSVLAHIDGKLVVLPIRRQ